MSPKGKSKRSKKGESSGSTQLAVDVAKGHNGDFVDSTPLSEIESLKKENDMLKNQNVELIAENKLLKEELQKFKETIDPDNNVGSETQENNSMDIEFINSSEVVPETSKNTDNSSERQCVAGCVDTTEVDWNPQGDAKQDVYHTSKGNFRNQKLEHDQENACGYTENVHVGCVETSDGNWNSLEDTKHDRHSRDSESEHEDVHGNTTEQNYGSRDKGYDKKPSRCNKNEDEFSRQHENSQSKSWTGYKRTERYDGNKSGRGHHSRNDQYNDRGYYSGRNYQQGHSSDQRRGNDWQYYGNDSREKNQSRYDKHKGQPCKVKIIEKDGDLFTAPKDHSLAHCVAADLRMGSGIAVQFKQQFKNVDWLLDQRKKVGQVAVLEEEEDGRYIYYLITKKFSTGKPRLEDLQDSLTEMKEHVERHQVKNIAIPRLGCGLDRLHWRDVRTSLNEIFADVDVTITVYNFTVDSTSSSSKPPPKKPSIYVTDKLMKLVNIDKETLLVLFGSECGFVDNDMKELDEKFSFIHEYKAHSKKLGDIVEIIRGIEMICVLIVKKHRNDRIVYAALLECFLKLRKPFKHYEYSYMGLTAFTDGDDDLTVAKIVTLLKIAFANVGSNAWICWPAELKNIYDEYNSSHKADT